MNRRHREDREERSRSRVFVGNTNDDDSVDGNTEKNAANCRFLRNHKLISTILSDTVVVESDEDDLNAADAIARLETLRNHSSLLEDMLKAENEDIEVIKRNHEAKKREWELSAAGFNKKISKLSHPFKDAHINVLAERFYTRMRQQQREQEALDLQRQRELLGTSRMVTNGEPLNE